MAREKKQLHPADKERKKQRKKDLKRNKDNRKVQRAEVLSSRKPEDILKEIYRINRASAAGTADDKMLTRKRILIEAHKQAVQAEKDRKAERKLADEAEPIVIKGMSKIFKNLNKPKEKVLALTMAEGADDDEDDEVEPMGMMVAEEEAFFTPEDEDAMVFDDDIIAVNEDLEFIEVPPGINTPPGCAPRHMMQRLVPGMNMMGHPMQRAMMGQPGHPGHPMRGGAMGGRPAMPPAANGGQGPNGERRGGGGGRPAFDPLDPNPDTNPQLAKRGLVGAGNQPPLPRPTGPNAGMAVDSGEGGGVPPASAPAPGAAPAPVVELKAAPQKPRTALSAAMRQFVPSALLVKRQQPKRVIVPKRKAKPAKPAAATASKKTTKQAYDVFMSEMESLGALGGDDDN